MNKKFYMHIDFYENEHTQLVRFDRNNISNFAFSTAYEYSIKLTKFDFDLLQSFLKIDSIAKFNWSHVRPRATKYEQEI